MRIALTIVTLLTLAACGGGKDLYEPCGSSWDCGEQHGVDMDCIAPAGAATAFCSPPCEFQPSGNSTCVPNDLCGIGCCQQGASGATGPNSGFCVLQ
ncbi:MAG: hypothetical protein IRZ16_23910 [Myxococcaceae bacterium]|nr:hypothetical protein [Myxococcaceae bacterium]